MCMQTRAARPTHEQRTFCSCLMVTNSLSEGQTGLWNTTFTLALFKLRTIYIRGFCMMHLRSSLALQCTFNALKREHTVQEGKSMFFHHNWRFPSFPEVYGNLKPQELSAWRRSVDYRCRPSSEPQHINTGLVYSLAFNVQCCTDEQCVQELTHQLLRAMS